MDWPARAGDALAAAKLTATSRAGSLLRAWVVVPLGLAALLLPCLGVDALFRWLGVSFPASVACLVLLLAALLACEAVAGAGRTRSVVGVVDVPAAWSLRWINVFFTPAFVTLPLSSPIGAVEVLKIMAVFVVGFFVMMALAAYLTRGLQLALGASRRTRAEEPDADGGAPDPVRLGSRATSISLTALQPVAPAPQDRREDGSTCAAASGSASVAPAPGFPAQDPPPPTRAERWAAPAARHLDALVFAALFLLVGVPVYYAAGYSMPAQLTASVLCYLAASAVPQPWRQFLHPVLVSSLLTVLVVWPLAALRGDGLLAALAAYRTGVNYRHLDRLADGGRLLPGAGDVLGTLLDASIVSLALPMFQHRRELRAHWLAIAAPCALVSLGSLLAYPPLCVAVGISAERSLAFASRSLTLALATPATRNLGGDDNTVAALAIVSGIMGVLVGQRLMAWLGIPEDDYVTRGVTLGINSSAIATALLLRTDPRAAALSSLSMSLFGTVTVLFTSIPPIANLVRSLAGL